MLALMHAAALSATCSGASAKLSTVDCDAWGFVHDLGHGFEICSKTDPCGCNVPQPLGGAEIGCLTRHDTGEFVIASMLFDSVNLTGSIPEGLGELPVSRAGSVSKPEVSGSCAAGGTWQERAEASRREKALSEAPRRRTR